VAVPGVPLGGRLLSASPEGETFSSFRVRTAGRCAKIVDRGRGLLIALLGQGERYGPSSTVWLCFGTKRFPRLTANGRPASGGVVEPGGRTRTGNRHPLRRREFFDRRGCPPRTAAVESPVCPQQRIPRRNASVPTYFRDRYRFGPRPRRPPTPYGLRASSSPSADAGR